jgi:ureidoacrylate peracid hydrolase
MAKLDLTAAALLVVDFQNDFFHAGGFLYQRGLGQLCDEDREGIVENAAELIAQFKVAGKPVIWAPTILRPDYIDSALPVRTMVALRLPSDESFVVEDTWGSQAVDGLSPDVGELILPKTGCSAFRGTPLDRLLSNLGISTCVVISGGVFDGLADTVRHGGAYGYDLVVAPDACGYPAGSPHLAALDKRATFATTADIVSAIKPGQPEPRGARTALIVVDMQNDYLHPEGAQCRYGHNAHMAADQLAALVANTRRLLAAARAGGNPVVFVVTERRHDPLDNASPPAALATPPVPYEHDYLVAGSWGAEVLAELEVQPEDFVERKKGRSGFGFAPLHRILRNLGVSRCVLSGGAVHGCLEDTLREGASFGYAFTLATDAVYPGAPSEASRQVLGAHTRFMTTDEIVARLDKTSGS